MSVRHAIAFVPLVLACGGGTAVVRPSTPPPGWVTRPPETQGKKVYAVGMSGPTYYREDSIQYAKDDARAQLAATVSTQVKALMVDVQATGDDTFHDSVDIVSADEQYTDTVVQNAQILGTWIDEDGALSNGRRGTTYALGMLDLAAAPPPPKTATPPPPPPEQVHQVQADAAQAFDELEAEHQKKKTEAATPPAVTQPK